MKRSMRIPTYLRWTSKKPQSKHCSESADRFVDSAFVQNRIIYNAFGFPSNTYEFHWKSGHAPDDLKDEESGSIGIWIRASYINHSCYPLVRRSYIGDMMIFRAQADIPADTELKFGYISCLENYEQRQKMLRKWDFQCECQVCLAEKEYPHEKVTKRTEIIGEIIGHFEKTTGTDLGVYDYCSSHRFTSWV